VRFQRTVQEVLKANNLTVDDVKMLIPHQSNLRIIESTMDRLHFPADKVCINIDEYGNSSSGSVPLCFDQMRKTGKIGAGDLVILVAFGGGLTWASSLWRL
jgi:3-oxoacyl-[acyl-carrier-protein] synthase-3